MDRIEVSTPAGEARRAVPAMDQQDYPETESGCGPAAMLNGFLWWQNQRILQATVRGNDKAVLARNDFNAIEREIFGIRRVDRARLRGGTRVQEIICAMDRLAYQWSDGKIRMDYQLFEVPLKIADLLEFTRGQRSGILITRVINQDGRIGGHHRVSLVAGDRRGNLTIHNWGERVYGSLRNEPRGQFFYPQNVEHPALLVEQAVCFVPFHPDEDIALADLDIGVFHRRPSAPTIAPFRSRNRPMVAMSQTSSGRTFRVAFQQRLQGGYVYCLSNTQDQASAVFLRSFQGTVAPGGQLKYPTDLQDAQRVARGETGFGATAD